MSNLPNKLRLLNPKLYSDFETTKEIVSKLLQQYIKNFPTYTDHSIEHTLEVLNLAGYVLNKQEIDSLNSDEIYVLCMASILHDVGMCIPEDKIKEISNTDEITQYRKENPDFTTERYLRDIHHVLSYKFIVEEWEKLKIPSLKYAEAIGLVAQGHRKVDINDFEIYDPQFFVKNGREFVCLPFLSCILRIADELDISNLRTPEILFKYYIPDNKVSRKEWEKHKATIQVNFKNDKVLIAAKCTDHNILAALEAQFDKIKSVLTQCQKTIRSIHVVDDRRYRLSLTTLEPIYDYVNFDPKGIKYSFEVKNVINAFVGEDLYKNKDAALREVVQNAVDACGYKRAISNADYKPKIKVNVGEDFISIEDNGQGMDEFIIENYFGKLASSFYQQEIAQADFQAIGQFGIGVFSYFLISEFIDVETKRAEKPGLKFRTDRDPNVYFHFFDEFKKEHEGTKITLHLKPKYHSKFNLGIVSTFIQKTFPFVDIPISIQDEKEKVDLEADTMSISYDKDVLPHFYYNQQGKADLFQIIQHYEKNEQYEGVIAVVIPKDFSKPLPELYSILDNNSIETSGSYMNEYSKISISQKGVFINTYECRLDYTFGKINLIQKLKVNLSRTEFVDEDSVRDCMIDFEIMLVKKIFKEFFATCSMKSVEHKNFTDWFVSNYWTGYGYNSEMINLVKEIFCYEFNSRNELCYLTLEEVNQEFDEFMVFDNDEDIEKYSKNIDIPYTKLYLQGGRGYSHRTLLSLYIEFGESLTQIENRYFRTFKKSSFKKIIELNSKFHFYDFNIKLSDFNSIRVIVNYMEGHPSREDSGYYFYEEVRFNSNHPLIQEISSYLDDNKLNSIQIRLLKELFGLIQSFAQGKKKNTEALHEKLGVTNKIIEKVKNEGIPINTLKVKDLR